MTVGESICALLSPLVDGRVYPDTAPFSTPRPYITWQKIGGHVIAPLAKEVSPTRNGFFQINVWSALRDEADALALLVEDALVTADAFVAKPMADSISLHDDDLDLRGTQQDFAIWSGR